MNKRAQYFLFISLGCLMVVQPSFGQAGNDNPGGVTNEYHGSSEVAGQLDPYTGNGRREIDDVIVPGSIGAYPLKFARILTTRGGGDPSIRRRWWLDPFLRLEFMDPTAGRELLRGGPQ